MPQRIPSPRELQYHTQSIMQNALIKKKLEEQRENFRKRQENQQLQTHMFNVQDTTHSKLSPVKQNNTISSPTKLAFTPTSVLRKMTAEKDDETYFPNKVRSSMKQQQQQQLSPPQKANQTRIPCPGVPVNNNHNLMNQNMINHITPNGLNQFMNQHIKWDSSLGHYNKPAGK